MKEFYHNLLYLTQGVMLAAITMPTTSERTLAIVAAIIVSLSLITIITIEDSSRMGNRLELAKRSLTLTCVPLIAVLLALALWFFCEIALYTLTWHTNRWLFAICGCFPTVVIFAVLAFLNRVFKNYMKNV